MTDSTASAARSHTFTPDERRIVALASAGHLFAHFYMIMQAVLALKIAPDFHARFGMSTGETLRLTFVSYLLFGLGSFPAGYLTDRWNARWMLMVCMTGSGACAMLAGFASGPQSLMWALAGVGLFASIYHPAGLTLISRHVRARGWALGINGVWGNVGIAAAPFAAALLADTVGWRTAFVLLGAPGLILGLTVFLVGARRIAEPRATTTQRSEAGSNYRLYFLIMCAGLVFGGLGYRTTMTSAPALFVERVEILQAPVERFLAWIGSAAERGPLSPGAIMLAGAVFIGAVGHLVGGWIADRYDLRISYIAFYAIAVPIAFSCAHLAGLGLFAAFVGYFFLTLGMQSIENSILSRITPDRWRSTAFGLKFVLTFGVGALGALLTSAVIDRVGSAAPVYHWVGGFSAALTLIAIVFYAASRRAIPYLGQRATTT